MTPCGLCIGRLSLHILRGFHDKILQENTFFKKHLLVAFLCGRLFNVIGSERSSLLGQLVSVSTPFCIDRQRSFVNYLFTSASCNNWEQNKLGAPRSPKRPFPDESLFRLIPLKVTDTPSFRSNSACSLKHVLKWDKITETL